MIDLLKYSPKYSNKQKLLFKIINKIDDYFYDVQFEIDELILNNINYDLILKGRCYHPDKKYKINLSIKIFYHYIYNLTLNYSTRKELRQNYPNEYSLLIRNNWNDILNNFEYLNEKYKWTKEKCHQKALLCKTRKEFSNKYYGAYKSAWYNNWLNDICSHMLIVYKSWTKEECHQKALLCETKIEFSIKYNKAYKASTLNKWITDICSHMIILKNNYNKEECHQKALLCETKIEFVKNYQNYYNKAYRNNWLNDICLHMIKSNAFLQPRIIYCYIFEETNSIYVGLTKNFKRRHYSRIYKNNDCVIKHINTFNLTPKIKFLTDFIPAIEAQIKEQEFIDKYKLKGWNILNKQKAGSLGGPGINIREQL